MPQTDIVATEDNIFTLESLKLAVACMVVEAEDRVPIHMLYLTTGLRLSLVAESVLGGGTAYSIKVEGLAS